MPIDRMIERFLRILFWRQVSRAQSRGTSMFRWRRKDTDAATPRKTGPQAASADLPDEAAQDARPTGAQRAAARNARKAARLTRNIGRK